MKVRLKREIVTFGRAVDPIAQVGTYVAPEDWNAVVQDPDTVVIDTRNDYEVAIGTFDGAIDLVLELGELLVGVARGDDRQVDVGEEVANG